MVNITTSTMVTAPVGPQGIVPEGSPFEDLFRDFQDRNGVMEPQGILQLWDQGLLFLMTGT